MSSFIYNHDTAANEVSYRPFNLISTFFSLSRSLVYLFILVISLLGGIAPSQQVNAAGLGDLFGADSAGQQQSFLPVSEAFSVVPMQKGDVVTVSIEITPEHYIYKDKFKIKLPEGVTASEFSFTQPAHFVDDPDFGEVAVFDQPNVTATATLTYAADAQTSNQTATLVWQGCAKAGLCYPPQREPFTIKHAISTPAETSGASNAQTAATTAATTTTTPQSSASIDTNTQQTRSKAALSNNDLANNSAAQTSSQTSTNSIASSRLNQKESNRDSSQKNNIEENASDSPINDDTDATLNSNAQLSDIDDEYLNEPNVDGAIDDLSATSNLNTQSLEAQSINVQATNAQTTNAITTNAQTTNVNNTNTLSHTTELVTDPFGIATRPFLAFALLFLAGLTLAFTPCILPMLPIVSNIVARQHTPTAMQGMLLTGAYGLGVATAYGILGAVIAIFGVSLGIIGWLQNPVVLILFAAVFALLALYMLGALNLSLPQGMRSGLHRFSQAGDKYLGSVPGSFVAGALSALVVSPCVSGPLFGALLAVSTLGNPVLGFAALFMLGLGLSSPLILLGATQGNLMPKAGAWMDWVKVGFALMLFAVSLLLLERVLISPVMLIIWAIWFLVVAVWAWSWQGRATLFSKAIALVTGIWGITLVIGAAMGSHDTWQPLASINRYATATDIPSASIPSASIPTTDMHTTDMPTTSAQANAMRNPSRQGYPNQALSNPSRRPNTSQISNISQISNTSQISATSQTKVTTLGELDELLGKYPKVVVEVTAEWCIECRILERELFANPPAQLQGWQVVKLDITDTTDDSKAVLERYQIPGPPTFLYYVDGQLQKLQVGEISRDEFVNVLNEHP